MTRRTALPALALFGTLLPLAACAASTPAATDGEISVTRAALVDEDITESRQDDYPSSSSPGYQQSLQGLAHDESNWFIANQCNLLRIPVEADLDDHDGAFPAAYMGDVLPCWAPAWMVDHGYNCPQDPPKPDGYAFTSRYIHPRATPGASQPWATSCGTSQFYHTGDPAFHGGLLYVPIESTDGRHTLAVFDRNFGLKGMDYLQYKDAGGALHFQENAAWVAVQHEDEGGVVHVVSAQFSGVGALHQYAVRFPTTGGISITWERDIPLAYANGHPLYLANVQGGEYSPQGNLWLSSDYNDPTAGLDVVSPSGTLVAHHGVSYGYTSWPKQELEGLTFWNLDGRHAKINAGGFLTGQVHLILGESFAGVSDDDMWIKHYDIRDALENATPLALGQTRTGRAPDFGDPDLDIYSLRVSGAELGQHSLHVGGVAGAAVSLTRADDPSRAVPLTRTDGANVDFVGRLDAGAYLLTITGLRAVAPAALSVTFDMVIPPPPPTGCSPTPLCGGEVSVTCNREAAQLTLERQGAATWTVVDRISGLATFATTSDKDTPAGVSATYRVCAHGRSTIAACTAPFVGTINHNACSAPGDSGGGLGTHGGCVRLSNGKLRCYSTGAP